MTRFNLLTNYNDNVYPPRISLPNKLLNPAVIAFGRNVYVVKQEERAEKYIVGKTHTLAVRIFGGFIAIFLFPLTLIGLGMKLHSAEHMKYARAEQQTKVNKEQAQKALDNALTMEIIPLQMSCQQKIQYLKIAADAIEKGWQAGLEEELPSYANQFENSFKQLLLEMNNPDQASLKADVKQQLTYQEAVELKRSLSLLAWRQHHNHFSGDNSQLKYKEYHALIRQYYYERFSPEHLVRNLREKDQIPSLKIDFSNLNSPNQEKDTIIQGIKEAFNDSVPFTQVTWLHGTQSPTLVSLLKTDQMLKPSGILRETNQLAFCGENGKGCFGINKKNISGVPLKSAYVAIEYAAGGTGHSDETAFNCSADPIAGIQDYKEEMKN